MAAVTAACVKQTERVAITFVQAAHVRQGDLAGVTHVQQASPLGTCTLSVFICLVDLAPVVSLVSKSVSVCISAGATGNHSTREVIANQGFLFNQNIPDLCRDTGFTRRELYRVFATFKALCSLSESPSGIGACVILLLCYNIL